MMRQYYIHVFAENQKKHFRYIALHYTFIQIRQALRCRNVVIITHKINNKSVQTVNLMVTIHKQDLNRPPYTFQADRASPTSVKQICELNYYF